MTANKLKILDIDVFNFQLKNLVQLKLFLRKSEFTTAFTSDKNIEFTLYYNISLL